MKKLKCAFPKVIIILFVLFTYSCISKETNKDNRSLKYLYFDVNNILNNKELVSEVEKYVTKFKGGNLNIIYQLIIENIDSFTITYAYKQSTFINCFPIGFVKINNDTVYVYQQFKTSLSVDSSSIFVQEVFKKSRQLLNDFLPDGKTINEQFSTNWVVDIPSWRIIFKREGLVIDKYAWNPLTGKKKKKTIMFMPPSH